MERIEREGWDMGMFKVVDFFFNFILNKRSSVCSCYPGRALDERNCFSVLNWELVVNDWNFLTWSGKTLCSREC